MKQIGNDFGTFEFVILRLFSNLSLRSERSVERLCASDLEVFHEQISISSHQATKIQGIYSFIIVEIIHQIIFRGMLSVRIPDGRLLIHISLFSAAS